MSTAAESEPKTTAQPASASPLDAHAAPVSDTGKQSGKATAALVLGILGIVFGRQAKWHDPESGLATAGFVLGIVAVIVSIAIMIVRLVMITS